MTSPRREWDQLDNEPDNWFHRFEIYRLLGPNRSMRKAYRVVVETLEPNLKAGQPTNSWYKASQDWRWYERARAWDQTERAKFLEMEEEARQDARRRRLEMIQELQEDAFVAMQTADVSTLDKEEARRFLAQLRLLFGMTVDQQRREFGEATEIEEQRADLPAEIRKLMDKAFGKGDSDDG